MYRVRYDVLKMPDGANSDENGEKKQLDLGDFARGAQSASAACGCFAIAFFLAVIAFAARALLFR